MRPLPAVCAIIAVAAVSLPCLAQSFFFIRTFGEVTFSDAMPPDLAGTMDGFVGIQEGGFDFQFLVAPFAIVLADPQPGTFVGTFTLFGPSEADTVFGSLSGVSFLDDADGLTGSGVWLAEGGSGAYADLTGTGSFSYGTFLTGGSAFMSFEGALVPAPQLALPGLLFALLCRRTRRTLPGTA